MCYVLDQRLIRVVHVADDLASGVVDEQGVAARSSNATQAEILVKRSAELEIEHRAKCFTEEGWGERREDPSKGARCRCSIASTVEQSSVIEWWLSC